MPSENATGNIKHKPISQLFGMFLMVSSSKKTEQLKQLLEGVAFTIKGDIEKTRITGLCSDSRKIRPGNLFAALKGYSVDGHNYLSQAVAAGCNALLVNRGWQDYLPAADLLTKVAIIEVADTKTALGSIAANYYGHPDRQLTMIGITGTNGKTTTSFLVESILQACGKRPGVIGTVNYRFTDKNNRLVEMAAPFTTPESITLFELLRQMADEAVTDVVMEVSSHALAQARLAGLEFDIGVFTNLSRDHLDFHADMQHYFTSKKLLFTDHLKPGGRIVIVLDSDAEQIGAESPEPAKKGWGRQMHRELGDMFQTSDNAPPVITCGLQNDCDVYPKDYTSDITGIQSGIMTPVGQVSLNSPLVGEFNLRNMLCAIGIGLADNAPLDCIKKGLEDVKTIPGRLERVELDEAQTTCPAVFVDYAHTPDALENVLTTLKAHTSGRLVCIFGCGGDRDPGKRSLMGEIAGKLSDIVLATSDNPRSESPETILAQIEEGISGAGLNKVAAPEILSRQTGRGYDIIVSRRLAIAAAIRFARPEDVIIISGKGHEDYQISGKGKIFFDDRIEAAMQLQARAGSAPAWRLEWVQQITGAHLYRPAEIPVTFRNISTDTRTIQQGDLFIALQGENFDGRIFAQKAVAAGAAGLLIDDSPGLQELPLDFTPAIPVLLVPDTLIALGQLAGFLRRWNKDLTVIGLTGSSGKTTVKEMTGAILRQNHTVLKTEGNFNNLVGLPLTLFRLTQQHEIAVLEMGMNRPGEISSLTEIADPDIACIINVQEAHLEGLGNIMGVAQAKNELFAGLKPGGKAVINLDDEIVRSLAEPLAQEKITFGCHSEAYIRATDIKSLGEEGMEFTIHIGNDNRRVSIKALGQHNVTNSLAAAAMAHAAGCSMAEICSGLAVFQPYDKRARVEEMPGGLKVLNDCYNAKKSSDCRGSR